ncbi:MAG: CcmD family protein [candidate division Zixibacteria bacterium]|nr:CcmD family protein [candidate division Zixibacteria bacterium]
MDGNYTALAVTLVVWIGIFFFLMRLDRRVKDLEKRS